MSRPSGLYLGVDGGGTKTAYCLIGADGQVLAAVSGPSCYYLSAAGPPAPQRAADVAQVLAAGIARVCAAAGVQPDSIEHAFFGLPTYGELTDDVGVLDAAPRPGLGHDRYRCDNDMVCGWAGSLAGLDGVNVISGTGSMTYGERLGRGVRTGGWGEAFGDEGSGHWIGVRALQAFSWMSDGRLPPGPLADLLRAHLGLARDLDLVDLVLNRWRGDRRRVAALSPVVARAADQGDAVAEQILLQAGQELARLVVAGIERLGFRPGEQVPVSYSGGVFGSERVLAAFTAGLESGPARCDLRRPRFSPVVGAALHAATLAGAPLGESALAALPAG